MDGTLITFSNFASLLIYRKLRQCTFSASMSDDIVSLAIEDLSTIIEIENDNTEINPLNADKDTFTNQALVEVVDPNYEEQARDAVADQISFEAQDPNKEQALNLMSMTL